ncbi:MAG TPA: hypothetical protein PKD55_02455 [Bellilinea sp.]|nr:hypothetical protein [Bellilinea sp.]
MITYTLKVSQTEKDLVDTIKELQFGEVLELELTEDQPTIDLTVSRQTKELLNLIQDGNRFLHSIRVHQGEPTLAEVPWRSRTGISCRKQYRFN